MKPFVSCQLSQRLRRTAATLALGGAMLLFTACSEPTISSDEEFMAFYDAKLEELKGGDEETLKSFTQIRERVQKGLSGESAYCAETALNIAVTFGSKSGVNYMISAKGAKPDSFSLKIAAVKPDMDMMKFLIKEHGVKPDRKTLKMACFCGHLDLCKYLIEEQGVDPKETQEFSDDFYTCMMKEDEASYMSELKVMATSTLTPVPDLKDLMKRHVEIARYLMEKGSPLPKLKGNTVWDSVISDRVHNCPNTELRELILSAVK